MHTIFIFSKIEGNKPIKIVAINRSFLQWNSSQIKKITAIIALGLPMTTIQKQASYHLKISALQSTQEEFLCIE